MSEDKNKTTNFEEDFKDFDDDFEKMPLDVYTLASAETEETTEEETVPAQENDNDLGKIDLQDGSIFQNNDIPLEEEKEFDSEIQPQEEPNLETQEEATKETDQEFFERQQNQIQALLKEINETNGVTQENEEVNQEKTEETETTEETQEEASQEEIQENEEENIDYIHDELHEFHHGDPDHEKHWSNEEDSAIKKYIVYISKDYVPYIDNLSTDERSAYINDAIQKKLDDEENKKLANKRKRAIFNIIVMFFSLCLVSPIAIYVINKSIIATFNNYKYSQDNFEKLYKQKFTSSKIYQRSVQFNKLHPKN